MRINSVIDELKDSTRSLHRLIRTIASTKGRCVLFIDQFEEVWTQTLDENTQSHFFNLIVNAISEKSKDILLLVTLRGDFYDRPMAHPVFGKLVEANSKSIYPMELDDLRSVIEKPASLPDVSVKFEDHLVGDLLFEIRGESGALPLLQFTLDQLFRKRKGNLLTRKAYEEIGGVRGALAEHAESTYQSLPTDEHRNHTRLLFLRLIEPGTTEQETTRRRAYLNELILLDEKLSAVVQEVKNVFINARLLTVGQATVEVSHEALIKEWHRLAGWIKTAREDILFQQLLSRDAREWIRQGRRADDLYRGAKLNEAKEWAVRNTLSREEHEFLESALSAQKDEVDVLRSALEKEKGYNELTTRFTSTATHDFRTPLAIMSTSLYLLRNHYDRIDSAKRIDILDRIDTQVKYLINIVENMLILGSVTEKRLNFNPISLDIDNVLQEILNTFRFEFKADYFFNYVNLSQAKNIVADDSLLKLILRNLISNAVKFSPPGSTIEIQVTDSEHETTLEIKDQGIGIPLADQAYLFLTFHRGSNADSTPGSGLGLAIVKRAVEAHSGRIEVESQEGKGSTFRIIMPKRDIIS